MSNSPLVKAGFILAREFGWTPQQLQEMTMAQVSIYLHMLHEKTGTGTNER